MEIRFNRLVITIITCISAMLTSCSDDDNSSGMPTSAVYDFVTIDSTSEKGSVFTLQKNDDSPLICYYAAVNFSKIEGLSEGDRIILCYNRSDGETYTSGNIDVYGYALLSNTKKSVVTDSAAQAEGFACQPMKVNALWRTGRFINVDTEISVFMASKPKTFILATDSTTLSDEVPKLHLYYINADGNDGYSPYTIYGSFDINDIWSRDECKGIEVFYLTANGEKSQTFLK